MNLNLINDIINKAKESDLVQNFMEELSNHLENTNEKGVEKMSNLENNKELNNIKQENGLYQVVDFSADGVFLQDVYNNKVFEEKNIPQDLINKIGNDYILRYKNGTYNIEQELTDDFMNNLVGIQEYQKIKEDFIKQSNILEIDSNTHYKIQTREKDYSILSYGENNKNIIKVPNELMPYFTNEQTNLLYKNGKFEKI